MNVLSLCSGVGMIDYAAQQAGMTIVGQVEIDEFCQAVLHKHWPHVKRLSDINDVKEDTFGTIDVVAGGIPCQPFSQSGKQHGKSDDRYLWPQAFAIIQMYHPTWVFIENVAHFASMVLDDVSADLESQGYEARAFLLPACAVGAPHVRERCFIVAHAHSDGNARAQRSLTDGQRSTAQSTSGSEWRDSTESGRDVADTDSQRLETVPQSKLVRSLDEYAAILDGHIWPTGPREAQGETEPPRTVTKNAPYARQRLKAIGNAVVWSQVYPFFALMMQEEERQ